MLLALIDPSKDFAKVVKGCGADDTFFAFVSFHEGEDRSFDLLELDIYFDIFIVDLAIVCSERIG